MPKKFSTKNSLTFVDSSNSREQREKDNMIPRAFGELRKLLTKKNESATDASQVLELCKLLTKKNESTTDASKVLKK